VGAEVSACPGCGKEFCGPDDDESEPRALTIAEQQMINRALRRSARLVRRGEVRVQENLIQALQRAYTE
jgi:hypothetical protein